MKYERIKQRKYIFLGLIENCDIGLKGSDFSNKK